MTRVTDPSIYGEYDRWFHLRGKTVKLVVFKGTMKTGLRIVELD